MDGDSIDKIARRLFRTERNVKDVSKVEIYRYLSTLLISSLYFDSLKSHSSLVVLNFVPTVFYPREKETNGCHWASPWLGFHRKQMRHHVLSDKYMGGDFRIPNQFH